MPIADSELILNPDNSIYHLNILPEDVADNIITVGDPDRVSAVSNLFDTIELKKGKREFVTHTGYFNKKRITVISTGIGTDNIDIVLNELDALVNIDFKTREIKPNKKSLNIIRIGTSGAIQEHIPINSFLISKKAIGLDGLMHFYELNNKEESSFTNALKSHLNWPLAISPYTYSCSNTLANLFKDDTVYEGITVTNAGFYAPQGRQLRKKPVLLDFHEKLRNFSFQQQQITNLEMETAGIYGLAKLLGHKAVSMNAILANRHNGTFSKTPQKTVDNLIAYCLESLT